VPTPRFVVAGRELLGGPVLVGVVAGGEDRAVDVVEELGGAAVELGAAIADVAGSDQDMGRSDGWGRRRE
jgi:hypothetical protein